MMIGKLIKIVDGAGFGFLSPVFNLGANVYVHVSHMKPLTSEVEFHALINSVFYFDVHQRKVNKNKLHNKDHRKPEYKGSEQLTDNDYLLHATKAIRVEHNQIPWALIKSIKKTGIKIRDFQLPHLTDNFDPALKFISNFIYDNYDHIKYLQWFWKQSSSKPFEILLKEDSPESLNLAVHALAELLLQHGYISHFEFQDQTFKYIVTPIQQRHLVLVKNLFDKYKMVINLLNAELDRILTLTKYSYESMVNLTFLSDIGQMEAVPGLAFRFRDELFFLFYDSTGRADVYESYSFLKLSAAPVNFIWIVPSQADKNAATKIFYSLRDSNNNADNIAKTLITDIEAFSADFIANFVVTKFSYANLNDKHVIKEVVIEAFGHALLKLIPGEMSEPKRLKDIRNSIKDEMIIYLAQTGTGDTQNNALIHYISQVFERCNIPSKQLVEHMLRLALSSQIFLDNNKKPISLFSEYFYNLTSYDFTQLTKILRLFSVKTSEV